MDVACAPFKDARGGSAGILKIFTRTQKKKCQRNFNILLQQGALYVCWEPLLAGFAPQLLLLFSWYKRGDELCRLTYGVYTWGGVDYIKYSYNLAHNLTRLEGQQHIFFSGVSGSWLCLDIREYIMLWREGVVVAGKGVDFWTAHVFGMIARTQLPSHHHRIIIATKYNWIYGLFRPTNKSIYQRVKRRQIAKLRAE